MVDGEKYLFVPFLHRRLLLELVKVLVGANDDPLHYKQARADDGPVAPIATTPTLETQLIVRDRCKGPCLSALG